MRAFVKRSIRGVLRGMGLDIRRIPESAKNRYGWLRDFRIRTILDVGANTGQFAREINRFLPDAAICCFEPVRDQFAALARELRGVGRARVFNLALGNINGTTRMNRNDFAPSSSLLETTELARHAYPFIKHSHVEDIAIRRLDDAIPELEIRLEPEVLLKLDVQGYEGEVIAGATQTVRACRVILAEVSFREIYKGQPLFDGFYDLMKGAGFAFAGLYETSCHNENGMPLYGDAVFLRDGVIPLP